MNPIYLKTDKEFTSAKDVIEELFSSWLGVRQTYARYTYSDKECTQLQCAGQRRSFEDMLALARTYFPETTEKELMQILVEGDFKCIYCCDINKIVFFGTGSYIWNLPGEFHRTGRLYCSEDTYENQQLLELYNQVT